MYGLKRKEEVNCSCNIRIQRRDVFLFMFSGSLDYGDGNGYTRDAHGNYWSSRLYFGRAYDLSFGDIDIYVYMYSDTRASGYSVRCVQE